MTHGTLLSQPEICPSDTKRCVENGRALKTSKEEAVRLRASRYLFKPIEKRSYLSLGKSLAVGVKLGQQGRKCFREEGENLPKFLKRATKRTNSCKVFSQSRFPFRLVFLDALPISTGNAGRGATGTLVRQERFPAGIGKGKDF